MIIRVGQQPTVIPIFIVVVIVGALFIIGTTTAMAALAGMATSAAIAGFISGVWYFCSIIGFAFFCFRFLAEVEDEHRGYREMPVRRIGKYFFTRMPGYLNFWIIKSEITQQYNIPQYATYSYKQFTDKSLCSLIERLYVHYAPKLTDLPVTYGSKTPHLTGCDEVVWCKGTRSDRFDIQWQNPGTRL